MPIRSCLNTYIIHITGLVQGVGFRPFVYRVAMAHKLNGEVENSNEGVFIRVNAEEAQVETFCDQIRRDAPVASRIDNIKTAKRDYVEYTGFKITLSEDVSDAVTGVSPDITVCDDCLKDIKEQKHRIAYPFTNCTNCGPRFSIIRDLPYDREMTTMAEFRMCKQCRVEYNDVTDRRFHAQPVACNHCGPVYSLEGDSEISGNNDEIVNKVAKAIDSGKIVAVKGMGGYHLLCDALNEVSVKELRNRKLREGKPFAIMCPDIASAANFATISSDEEKLMSSWERPVVILSSFNNLAYSVSNGLDSIGIILPYMPFHYLLFERLITRAIVFTSANISDEPVVIENSEALRKLGGIADIIVSYNRDIYNRADDSVARIMGAKPVIIRRSRGYAPSPVKTLFDVEGVFAAGAELVNAFAIGKGEEAVLSQYIGDLKNQATYDFYRESYSRFKRLFRFSPSLVVRDMHPDYLSSVFADFVSLESGAKIIEVQHHHAHIASCMAENRVEGEVIGLSLDGVGLGSDGNIWGGEVLLAGYRGFERLYHFEYIPILGADKVSADPWRSALSYLHKYGLLEKAISKGIFKGSLTEKEISLYVQGVEKRINTHLYSSAGRLFDAVSSMSGLVQKALFHAEAPMRLEAIARKDHSACYSYSMGNGVISFGPCFEEILDDLGKEDIGTISARFHNSVCAVLADAVDEISGRINIDNVVLSGGTFQNNMLVTVLKRLLEKRGKRVYLHGVVPPNDNGIALGQLVIGAAIRADNKI